MWVLVVSMWCRYWGLGSVVFIIHLPVATLANPGVTGIRGKCSMRSGLFVAPDVGSCYELMTLP